MLTIQLAQSRATIRSSWKTTENIAQNPSTPITWDRHEQQFLAFLRPLSSGQADRGTSQNRVRQSVLGQSAAEETTAEIEVNTPQLGDESGK
jgi:hypothetical protein